MFFEALLNPFQADYASIERRALMHMIDDHRKMMTDILMLSPPPTMLVPRDSFPGLPDFIGDPHFNPTWELPKDVTFVDQELLTKTQKLLSEQIDLYTQACITAGRILPLEPEASAHAIRSRDPSRET